jgi:hydrolase, NUDIX family
VISESDPNWKVSVNALIETSDGMLLVKPSYKKGWDLPGGIVESDESPVEGLRREIVEELGTSAEIGGLRCVDYIRSDWESRPVIMLIFSATININEVCVDGQELIDWRIVSRDIALDTVSKNMKIRLSRIWSGTLIYGESPQ